MRLRVTHWLLILAALHAAAAADLPRTVIVIRHADRAGAAPDAGISEAGRCRSQGLAKILADARVTAIYTSEVARTQQTAEPLATQLHLQPETVAAKEVDALVVKLRARQPGSVALVVGHSNTVPQIVERLGAGAVPPIGEAEFDRMFIVTLIGKAQATVMTLHYPGCAN